MSERFETKHCTKALYKYSSFLSFYWQFGRELAFYVTLTNLHYANLSLMLYVKNYQNQLSFDGDIQQ